MAVNGRDMGDCRYSVSKPPATGLAAFTGAWRSLLTGLRITGTHAMEKPGTVRYPFEKLTMSPRWRGSLRLRGVLGLDDVALITGEPPAHNEVIESLLTAERLPPCVGTCPANVDARGQNYLIADGKTAEAYELVRERNILPGVLGRICHHPCEGACTRSVYDEPIAIRPLHRFAYESYVAVRDERVKPLPKTRGKSVAIIGSGPSGLSAALDLMRLGYAVTSFEKDDKPGGALYSGVPAYRLPRDVLHGEIDDLVRMGLDLRCNVEIGRDVTLPALRRDYDAVLIAAGLQTSRILPLPGADAEGVRGAIEFLGAANFTGEAGVRGKRVLVIGGGNVAVGVARGARRAGASDARPLPLQGLGGVPPPPGWFPPGSSPGRARRRRRPAPPGPASGQDTHTGGRPGVITSCRPCRPCHPCRACRRRRHPLRACRRRGTPWSGAGRRWRRRSGARCA